MPLTPRAEQLAIPAAYGTPSQLLDWKAIRARIAGAHHYWLATVRADGRPHTIPMDGLWMGDDEEGFYFGGAQETVKHRNLLANPNATLHLEDATSAVIVEGTCAITMPTDEMAEQLAAESKAKYGYGPPPSTYRSGVWLLSPTKVIAWTDLTVDATRFVFG